MAELRSAADWLKVLDSAREWHAAFHDKKRADKYPFVLFAEISAATRLDGLGEGLVWEGDLIVPLPIAVEMMKWLEGRALEELKKLGVKA